MIEFWKFWTGIYLKILLDSQNNENEASLAAESSQYKHSTQSDAGIVYKSVIYSVV